MKFSAEWDIGGLLLRLRNGQKRLAYAVQDALNRTALKVQQASFDNVRRKFSVRDQRFMFGTTARVGGVAGRITQFAKVKTGVMYTEVVSGRDAAGNLRSPRSVLLGTFERGGIRRDKGGITAVPLTGAGRARPSMGQGLDPRFTFAAMKLTAFQGSKRARRGRRGIGVFGEYGQLQLPQGSKAEKVALGLPSYEYKGRDRTFLLTHSRSSARGGVFQRFGKGRGDIRMIWKFQDGVRIDNRLHFFQLARATWRKWYREYLTRNVLTTLARHGYAFTS